ncbi:DUF3105 domain-containing protein [Nitriliruptoraceae bacterium ZYF776]|nr:DUF3105 domain-containing protein [Profundirhabdus halotolerans]
MAERERLTNKERRAQARDERRRKEAEAAAKAKRDRVRNLGIGVVVVALVAAIGIGAWMGRAPSLDDVILVSASEADAAREAAGCEVLALREPLPERYHFEAPNAPAPDSIYTDVRPTHSGPHLTQYQPVSEDGYSSQLSEVASTHNLEHGTVAVWWDPEQVDGSTVSEIRDWTQILNANGFRENPPPGFPGGSITGAGILAAPYEDPGISSGQAVAFRAWGTAMDCDVFDETVANAFVAEHFGTRGIGPERTMAPYPEEVLDFSDQDLDDTTSDEAPIDGETPAELDEDAIDEELGDDAAGEGADEVEQGADGVPDEEQPEVPDEQDADDEADATDES